MTKGKGHHRTDLGEKCGTSSSIRIKVRNGYKTYRKQKISLKTSKQFNNGIDRAKQFMQKKSLL